MSILAGKYWFPFEYNSLFAETFLWLIRANTRSLLFVDWMFSQPWRGHYSQWSLFITFRAGVLYGPCWGSWGLWMESFSSAYLHTLSVLRDSVLDLFQILWIIRSFCFPLIPNSVLQMTGADWEFVLFLKTEWQLMLLGESFLFSYTWTFIFDRMSFYTDIGDIMFL